VLASVVTGRRTLSPGERGALIRRLTAASVDTTLPGGNSEFATYLAIWYAASQSVGRYATGIAASSSLKGICAFMESTSTP
jgi:hypothetical protein